MNGVAPLAAARARTASRVSTPNVTPWRAPGPVGERGRG